MSRKPLIPTPPPEPEPETSVAPPPPSPVIQEQVITGTDLRVFMEQQSAQFQMLVGLVQTVIQKEGPTDTNPELLNRLAAVLDGVTKSQESTAAILANAQAHNVRPSNQVAHMKSELNPRGELCPGWEKPKLLCQMMIPWRAENESQTREEVELLNLIAKCPGAYIVKRNDDTKVRITVRQELDESGTRIDKVIFSHDTAFRNEYFRTMPPAANFIRQMLKQCADGVSAAADLVLTMDQEKELIAVGNLTVSP